MEIGQDLVVEGKNAGIVTSTASGPHGHIALGFLKSTVLDEWPEQPPIITAGLETVALSDVF